MRMIAKWDDRGKNNTSADLVLDEHGNGYNTGDDCAVSDDGDESVSARRHRCTSRRSC